MQRATSSIDLALQGGGSHGAFTWGALDKLLEEGSLDFAGISGTSAGALSGAVLITGLARGGPEGARQALHDFWHDVARANSCFDPLFVHSRRGATPLWDAWTAPIAQAWAHWARSLSPYQLNPLGLNLAAPALFAHGTEEQRRRYLPPSCATRRCGASSSPSRAPAATWPRWPAGPSATATGGC